MTHEQKIAEEINNIIISCKAIRRLTGGDTVIPEEYIYNPAGNNKMLKEKIGIAKIAADIAAQQLDHLYNINPLKDDHGLTRHISDMRNDMRGITFYFESLLND